MLSTFGAFNALIFVVAPAALRDKACGDRLVAPAKKKNAVDAYTANANTFPNSVKCDLSFCAVLDDADHIFETLDTEFLWRSATKIGVRAREGAVQARQSLGGFATGSQTVELIICDHLPLTRQDVLHASSTQKADGTGPRGASNGPTLVPR